MVYIYYAVWDSKGDGLCNNSSIFFVLFLNEMYEPVIQMFLKSSPFLQLLFSAANMFYIYKL